MGSSSSTEAELQTRVQQQEVVAELGKQALETDDLDQLMDDASVAVADTLDNEYCKVLELLPGGDEVFLRQGNATPTGSVSPQRVTCRWVTVPTVLKPQWTSHAYAPSIPQMGIHYAIEMRGHERTAVASEADVSGVTMSTL